MQHPLCQSRHICPQWPPQSQPCLIPGEGEGKENPDRFLSGLHREAQLTVCTFAFTVGRNHRAVVGDRSDTSDPRLHCPLAIIQVPEKPTAQSPAPQPSLPDNLLGLWGAKKGYHRGGQPGPCAIEMEGKDASFHSPPSRQGQLGSSDCLKGCREPKHKLSTLLGSCEAPWPLRKPHAQNKVTICRESD
ncbi:hypothetical protein P7K49_002299 [Saguinus oedipus]|uniref:Uncharacterized protein n=1 Tax=Saguinus oedipus TaxID=9490 RepID=A0ABQ9WGX4_SAGOE|nr:hypothetical protein P7K49_002299 [Saguinus oedipus]